MSLNKDQIIFLDCNGCGYLNHFNLTEFLVSGKNWFYCLKCNSKKYYELMNVDFHHFLKNCVMCKKDNHIISKKDNYGNMYCEHCCKSLFESGMKNSNGDCCLCLTHKEYIKIYGQSYCYDCSTKYHDLLYNFTKYSYCKYCNGMFHSDFIASNGACIKFYKNLKIDYCNNTTNYHNSSANYSNTSAKKILYPQLGYSAELKNPCAEIPLPYSTVSYAEENSNSQADINYGKDVYIKTVKNKDGYEYIFNYNPPAEKHIELNVTIDDNTKMTNNKMIVIGYLRNLEDRKYHVVQEQKFACGVSISTNDKLERLSQNDIKTVFKRMPKYVCEKCQAEAKLTISEYVLA